MDQLKVSIKKINSIIDEYFGRELDKYKAYTKIYKTHDYEGGPCPASFSVQKSIVNDFKRITNKDDRAQFSIDNCVKDSIYSIYLCSKMRDEKNLFFKKHLDKIDKFIYELEKNLEVVKQKDQQLFDPPILEDWYKSISREIYDIKGRKENLIVQERKHEYPSVLVDELLNGVCNLNKKANARFKESLRNDAKLYFKQKDKEFQDEYKRISSSSYYEKKQNLDRIKSLQYDVKYLSNPNPYPPNKKGKKSKKKPNRKRKNSRKIK